MRDHSLALKGTAMQDEKRFRAKISDFGLSHHMSGGQTHVDISQGTEAYLPHEVFREFKITEATDVYSLGLLMWEMFYGIFWFSVYDAERTRRRCAFSKISQSTALLANASPFLFFLWTRWPVKETSKCVAE
jgi:serine/threonine protein kinase